MSIQDKRCNNDLIVMAAPFHYSPTPARNAPFYAQLEARIHNLGKRILMPAKLDRDDGFDIITSALHRSPLVLAQFANTMERAMDTGAIIEKGIQLGNKFILFYPLGSEPSKYMRSALEEKDLIFREMLYQKEEDALLSIESAVREFYD